MATHQSILNEFDPLSQAAASSSTQRTPATPLPIPGLNPNSNTDRLIRRVEEHRALVLDGLQSELAQVTSSISNAAGSGIKPRITLSKSPPRSSSLRLGPRRRSSDAQVSPVEADFFHPSGPPASDHALRRRLSRSLGSDEYTDFVSSQTSSESHHSPPHTTLHFDPSREKDQEVTQTLNISNTSKSIGKTVKALKPAIANLFSDQNPLFSDPSPSVSPSSNGHRSRPTKFFTGAPGFDSSAPLPSFARPPSAPKSSSRSSTFPSPKGTLHPGSSSSAPPSTSPSPPPPAPVSLLGLYSNAKSILSADTAEGIRPSLPSRLRVASAWTILYSLDMHGVSIATLYTRVRAGMSGRGTSAGLVLVVQSSDGHCFGAFINEALRRSDAFYGSGEW